MIAVLKYRVVSRRPDDQSNQEPSHLRMNLKLRSSDNLKEKFLKVNELLDDLRCRLSTFVTKIKV